MHAGADRPGGDHNLQTLGQNLYALGGRHFLMVGPYGGGASKDSLRTQLSAAVQTLIAAGVDIRYFDTRSPLLNMMAVGNPYGFVNTSSAAPCYTGSMGVPGTLCEMPDTYVFWDSKGHLSARAHAAMGNLMEAALAIPPGKPAITGISVRGNSALVAFTPPNDVGSNPISGYTATCTPVAGGTGNVMSWQTVYEGTAMNAARVVSPTSPIVGTWLNAAAPIGPAAFTFFANGTYLLADNGNTTASDPTGQPGLEIGTYAYNPATGALSTTCPGINSDGEWGLSHGKRNGLAGCVGTAASIVMNGISASAPSSPITVPGLTRGLTYSCTVHATNSSGNGAESLAKIKLLRASPLVPVMSVLQN